MCVCVHVCVCVCVHICVAPNAVPVSFCKSQLYYFGVYTIMTLCMTESYLSNHPLDWCWLPHACPNGLSPGGLWCDAAVLAVWSRGASRFLHHTWHATESGAESQELTQTQTNEACVYVYYLSNFFFFDFWSINVLVCETFFFFFLRVCDVRVIW